MAAKRSMVNLCLIRCGETTWESAGRLQGDADLPLSDAGRATAQAEAAKPGATRATVIHHPADEAAAETAKLFADAAGAQAKAVADLADPSLGLLQGLTIQEFAERFPSRYKQWMDNPLTMTPPDGEVLIHAAERIFKAVARLLKRARGSEVAVVLHPLALGMLRCWLADQPLGDLHAMLTNRPNVERYVLAPETIAKLETAAAEYVSGV